MSGDGASQATNWTVFSADALRRWLLDKDPDDFTVSQVRLWIRNCESEGPPLDGVTLEFDADTSIALVPRTAITTRYLVVADDRERLIIVKDFD